MKKPKKSPKTKATAKFKDFKTKKNPTGGVFKTATPTNLIGGGVPNMGMSAGCKGLPETET
jgi:hypothetical protein